MGVPVGAPQGFPYETGSETFTNEYSTAVAPGARDKLKNPLPLFLLSVPGADPEYDRHVNRVVEALRGAIEDRGKLVPYAVLRAGGDPGASWARAAADELLRGIPGNMTPDRLPSFSLLRDVVAEAVRLGDGLRADAAARAIRNSAYALRAEAAGLPALLWRLGGGDRPVSSSGAIGWLIDTVWAPSFQNLPRWFWGRWKTHRLIRPLSLSPRNRRRRSLGTDLDAERGEDLFGAVYHWVWTSGLFGATPLGEEAAQACENLLVRALLEDLEVPSVGGLLPKRRRRTVRPVLLLALPHDSAHRVAAERFLKAFHTAHSVSAADAVRAPGPLVVAVGQPSTELLGQLDPDDRNFATAAGCLARGHDRPVRVTFSAEALLRAGHPVSKVKTLASFRTNWRLATALVTAVASVVAAGIVVWFPSAQVSPCVGGDDTVDKAARTQPVEVHPAEWYDAAVKEIDTQNARAVDFAKAGRTVRTVVVFVSNRPTSSRDTVFDGVIPELRGIAMWQKKLNDDANSDSSEVPLRVDVRETGVAFARAEQAAKDLVKEIGYSKGIPAYERVIGVLGYAQSRDETKAALTVLDKAKVLVVDTTATADEMLGGANYWPMTPLNSREAAVEANFVATSDIVARPDGGCVPAKHAVVIETYGDLYSRSLADQFVKDFSGSKQLLNFTQDRTSAAPPAGTPAYDTATNLAARVCAEVKAQPDSVIYWSARARDFTAFINAFNTAGTCLQHDLTVLGGNELTNVSQTGAFSNKDWLRLYYSAHRLPDDDKRASAVTRTFVNDYENFVKATTTGDDPWAQDGHSAVAYDAFHTFSLVANMTYNQQPDAPPSQMEINFRNSGATFNGATGYVQYAPGVNQPPADKTLVLLRQIGQKPVAVAACGAYDQDQSSVNQGEPCSATSR
ncbi:ABC transporter substrate-binding protein [Streptomyces sp. NPDC002667]|uniref:ABC transporter substrate-binding protein n=1 Tax=Streptomyces sp. NPDC002667 TaxID=3364657 RepID=UPI003697E26C